MGKKNERAEVPQSIEESVYEEGVLEQAMEDELKEDKVEKKDGKMSKGKIIQVDADNSVTQVLQWNQGNALVFDHLRFLHLPDSAIALLSEENRKAYYIGLGMAEQSSINKRAAARVPRIVQDPLGSGHWRFLMDKRLRPRRGYHQTSCSPLMLDHFLSMGYVRIREPDSKQKEAGLKSPMNPKGYEPGQENGSVSELQNEDGRVSLIFIEIDEATYQQHLEALSAKSQGRLNQQADQVQEQLSQAAGTEVKVFSGQRPNDLDFLTESRKRK